MEPARIVRRIMNRSAFGGMARVFVDTNRSIGASAAASSQTVAVGEQPLEGAVTAREKRVGGRNSHLRRT